MTNGIVYKAKHMQLSQDGQLCILRGHRLQFLKLLLLYLFRDNRSQVGPLCTLRGQRLYFLKSLYYFATIDFVLANSADPDEMPHDAAFHLGLH